MALRFMDSFDHYTTAQLPRKWTSVGAGTVIITAAGRNSGSCLRLASNGSNCNVLLTLDAQATWVVGYAIKLASLPTAVLILMRIQDAGSTQVDVRINTDGTVSVTRNGTAVTGGTSTLAFATAQWYYFEFKVTIADSIAAGSCKVQVGGVNWVTVATGQDLKATANATASQILLSTQQSGGTAFNLDIDDLYILDGNASTPANNDFLGDRRVECLYPNGAGANTTWTPSSSTNFSRVNETTPDDDTTYVEDSTAGHRDSYAFGNLASNPININGVQTVLCHRKTDAGARTISDVCVSGVTTSDGASISVGDTYAFGMTIRETDPNTGAAWTQTNLNAAEFGEKLVA